jgi:predicted Zn-dependent protease
MSDDKNRNYLAKLTIKRFIDRHRFRYGATNRAGYRLFIRMVALIILVLVVAGAFWAARPFYRHYKEHRAVTLAGEFLAHGDYLNARLRARQALLLNPADGAAIRIMATLAARAHSPDELNWRRRAVAAEPTLENKLLLAAAGLRYERPPFPLAGQILDDLAAVAVSNAEYQELAARLALANGHPAEAETHLAAALQLEPANRLYSLNLAVYQLGQTNETRRRGARTRLEQLRTDSDLGPGALRALITDRLAQKDIIAANNFSAQLLAFPQASLTDQLQNLEILQQLKDGCFSVRLQAVQQNALTNAPAVGTISSWMRTHGLLAENLQWLEDLPNLQEQPPVELALASAYEQSGDWRKLLDFVSPANWGKLEYLRLAVASHASAQLGMTEAARGNWTSAMNQAAGHLDALQKLLELAVHWQLKPEQEDLLVEIVRDFPGEQWAGQALATRYFGEGNTPALNRLFAQLAAAFPANTDYQNNLAFTALLLQTNLPAAEAWATAAHARTPTDPQVTAAYAYARHLQYRDAEGLAALNRLKPAELAQPSPALYYGVLLTSAGKPGEAAPWLKLAQARASSLLPEEKLLLASSLARGEK